MTAYGTNLVDYLALLVDAGEGEGDDATAVRERLSYPSLLPPIPSVLTTADPDSTT